MSEELKELREILKTLEQHSFSSCATDAVRRRIAKLEAEAADPWREAKEQIDAIMLQWNESTWQRKVADYAGHLESENARLTARVAELESQVSAMAKAVDFDALKFDTVAEIKKCHTEEGMSRVISIGHMIDALRAKVQEEAKEKEWFKARVAELESRLDAEDMYRQEQNERSE